MRLRQQKRRIIGVANLDERILSRSVRAQSYAGPIQEKVVDDNKFMESDVYRKQKTLMTSTKVVKKRVYNDDFNLAKLAVNDHSELSGPNLQKLAEIKKCLIKKYDQKTNYLEIFKLWDGEGKGHVQFSNIKSILASMNIKVTDEEAKILLTSADMRQVNQLGACEFFNLLFDQDSSITRPNDIQLSQPQDIVEFLQDENRIREDQRQVDHLQNLLYKQANKFNRGFKMLDILSQGKVNKEQFTKVFRKILYLRDVIVSDEQLETIYNEHKITNNTFNYISFLQNIQSKHLLQTQQLPQIKQTVLEYVPSILDKQCVTVQSLDKVKKQAISQIKKVKKNYQTEEDFKVFLQSYFNVEDKDYGRAKITQSQVKDAFMEAVGSQNSKDVDAIMNLYAYSGDKQTLIKDLIKPIYNENPMEMYQRTQMPKEELQTAPQLDEHDNLPSKKKTQDMLDFIRSHKHNKEDNGNTGAKFNRQYQGSFKVEGVHNSSSYITEEKRLHYDKLDFSRDEKIKKLDQDANRLLRIRNTSDQYNNRVKQQEEQNDMKIQNCLLSKQRLRAHYEKRNSKY